MENSINIYTVLGILFIHWVADFVLQTEEQAINKSKSVKFLTYHVLTYTAFWFICISLYACCFYLTFNCGAIVMREKGKLLIVSFTVITFVCHWITDYLTSKLNTKLLPKREQHNTQPEYFRYIGNANFHNFFTSIGFDQILHYTQLFLTFNLLIS